MNAQTALEAIRARIQGEWDNPALVAFGPLGKTDNDILDIIESVEPDPAPVVNTKTYKKSGDRADYCVSITVGDREVTPHVFVEQYKADWHTALYRWLFGQGDKPGYLDWGPDDWPAVEQDHSSANAKLQAHARAMSEALLKVRPLGGSEMFSKVGEEYLADPVKCGDLIDQLRHDLHEERSRRIRAERDLQSALLDRGELQ